MQQLRETATISERAAQAAKSTGKMLVQFISPGWGSSGYYSPEVLQEAAANRVISAGTHMYADHPTQEDRNSRPERSIRDLMAVTTSDAQLAPDGALIGEIRVMAPYQELITDLKDHIGVSVFGDATDIYEGEAEGRRGNIIEGINKVSSVDFVTRPGRGGQVLELLESALHEETVEVIPDSWLADGIHVELAEALEEVATSAAGVEGTAKLHAYWRTHIKWGKAGDFDECVRHLSKYVRDPKGYCAKMHKDVTGATPGHAAGESEVREIPEFGSISEGKVYHWKHGWIPLDHADAPEAQRTQQAQKAAAVAKDAAKIAPVGSHVRIGGTVYVVRGHNTVPVSKAYNNPDGDKFDLSVSRLNSRGEVGGTSSSRMTLADLKSKVTKDPPSHLDAHGVDHNPASRSKESDVPATRPDSTTTIEETTEVTMGKIQIEEADYDRVLEEAGRVDALTSERDTEKARADELAAKLAEATKAPEAGSSTTPTPRTSHAVVVEQLDQQKHEIAVLNARERARDIVAEEMTEAWVAPSTISRLTSGLLADLPLVEEKLDEIGLRTRCVEARDRAEMEAAETLEAAGFGKPTGIGASTPPAGGDAVRYTDNIAENLQVFGLSEAAAQTAAKGR